MNLRLSCLMLAAVLALPGFGQTAFPESQPPVYQAKFVYSSVPSGGSYVNQFVVPDAEAIRGLDVLDLLGRSGSASFRPGQLALVRNWDGDAFLSYDVGLHGGSGSILEVSLNGLAPDPTPAQASNFLQINDPVICAWTLLAQNGVFVTESVQLTYFGWQVLAGNGGR